jgi:hypothetical protein
MKIIPRNKDIICAIIKPPFIKKKPKINANKEDSTEVKILEYVIYFSLFFFVKNF